MRRIVCMVAALVAGCAGPVREVKFMQGVDLKSNALVACAWSAEDRRMVCMTPEDFLLMYNNIGSKEQP